MADYQGERYLVAMLGEHANWPRNVRAAGGRAVLRHGRREAVCLEEVDPNARAPIVRRYLSLAPGTRAFIPVDRDAPLEAFQKVAPQVPVCRVRRDRQAHMRSGPFGGGPGAAEHHGQVIDLPVVTPPVGQGL